jgi:methyl-accepting chemotaxis protein
LIENLNLCLKKQIVLRDGIFGMVDSVKTGSLDDRIDVSDLEGNYRVMAKGFNDCVNIFQSIFDALPMIVFATDTEANIRYINKVGAKVGKKPQSQYIGTGCDELCGTSICNTEKCAMRLATKNKEVTEGKELANTPSGEYNVAYTALPIVDEFGNVSAVYEFITDETDITKEMKRSEKIAQYQAEETEKIVDTLEKLSQGELDAGFTLENQDEETSQAFELLNKIVNASRVFAEAVRRVQDDIVTLSSAAGNGELSVRADIEAHRGEFVHIVSGINNILEEVTVPIDEAGQVLSQMATGDLSAKMSGNYTGDFEKLKTDINQLGNSLIDLVKQVNDTVEVTNKNAGEISQSTELLAAASNQMSVQATDVSASVEQMANNASEYSRAATETAEIATKNAQKAEQGGKVVKETIDKMNDIAEVVQETAVNIEKLGQSSKAIGDIVSVIDDIADQTNLLALNASIEAARAGEQGRGFAVVADEVRKLAEKTIFATQEIAGQISAIQKETSDAVQIMNRGTQEVQSGIELADNAGKSLDEILQASNEVTDMINNIAEANKQQAESTSEITRNVQVITDATAESTHQLEDVADTTEELSQLTRTLEELMRNFKIDNSGDNLELHA